MKIGILGSGDAAKSLGRGFVKHGHDVMLGTREASKLAEWQKDVGSRARVGSVADAARFGEIVVLAVLGTAAEAVAEAAGPTNLRGKLVLDATNPLDFSKGMPPGNFVGMTDSLGERLQRRLVGAHVVKCFNTVPNVQMIDPTIPGAEMIIAGDDADAKKRAEVLLLALGWHGVVDVGGIDGARWMEAFVPLWVRVCVAKGSFNLVFVPKTG